MSRTGPARRTIDLAPGAALALLLLALFASRAHAQTGGNVALGRPYTYSPAPSYALCTDPGDATQLTDGIETSGNFWSEKSTVGWQGTSPVTITIDLGSVTSIAGASFRTAAGKAGVEWPAAILVLASDDAKEFHPLGDLVVLSNADNGAPPLGYQIHRYSSRALHGHGRYVRFVVDPKGNLVFSDEIQVFSGPAEWTREAVTGAAVADPKAYADQSRVQRRVADALRRDLATAKQRVDGSNASPSDRARWQAELADLETAIRSLPPPAADFRAVLPLNPVHARIFALIGRVDAAAGQPPLAAWRANPWDFLTPVDPALTSPPALAEVSILRGETRPAAVNVRNASGADVVLQVAIRGLGAGTTSVAEVAWTETKEGMPVAAALPDAVPGGDGFRISVPAGMTRQVWLRISAAGLSPGRHPAVISLRPPGGAAIEVTVPVRVVDVAFPSSTRLHVGGWDYTNTDTLYGLTSQNVTPLVETLTRQGVDSPWATSAALPFGSYDASGRMTGPPDTANFDRWIQRWPNARRYMVFVDARERLGQISVDSPAFPAAVGAWLQFWTKHAAASGVKPEQLYLHLVDEPHDAEAVARLLPWARAIRSAGAGVRTWADPTFQPPQPIPPDLVGAVDAICVNRTLGWLGGAAFWRSAQEFRGPARSVEIYNADGPTRTMDPYTYYRLQAWQSFAIGGTGSSFWAFADNGGASSWNELAATATAFTPLFIDSDSVTAGKHMEALVEGAHDFEVLSLLRDAEAVAASGPAADRARAVLRDGVARVLGAPGAGSSRWTDPKERGTADEVRAEAADALAALTSAGAR